MRQEDKSGTFREITINQKQTWSRGDFHEIARQNVVMAESLCRAADPIPGQMVLDLACGSGTAALVAARRYCKVKGIDFVPDLVARANMRAEAEGLQVDFQVADAQDLPFPDNSFDVVLSVYGVQFAPDQNKAASEMIRVCRPGGRIALASPVPEGWSGDFFGAHAKHVPPPYGIDSPLRWGMDKGLQKLLGNECRSIVSEKKKALQYYLSVDHAVSIFSRWFGPTLRALDRLDEKAQGDLLNDLNEVFRAYNRSAGDSAVIENTYLQSLIEV